MNDPGETLALNGSATAKRPAIQVICLGSGGGPSEDNVTGFLVRSTSSGWVKGSLLAVDAGSHLAAVTRILLEELPLVSKTQRRAPSESHLSPRETSVAASSPLSSPPPDPGPPPEPVYLQSGPFAGVPFPFASARANAAHVVRNYVSTYLITHPHLDHISGFAINTAAFHATSRPKRLAALPFTVESIKQHIFNDVIWPNLTDEDGGVGFVTFQRLKEGGDIMVGEGDGRGYIEVCEGLGAKGFKISHGKCMRPGPTSSHRGSMANISDLPHGYNTASRNSDGMNHGPLGRVSMPGTPGAHQPTTSTHQYEGEREMGHAVDSTAYFIRDTATSREVLIFGDVEADSISIAPRVARVWSEAAPKIAAGKLTGVFIECSYDDSQADAVLFGHLAPRHLVAELQVLADMVREERAIRASERAMRKRKRTATSNGVSYPGSGGEETFADMKKRSRSLGGLTALTEVRRSSVPDNMSLTPGQQSPTPAPHVNKSFPPALQLHQPHHAVSSTPTSYLPHQLIRASTVPGAEVCGEGGNGVSTPLSMTLEPPLKGLKVIIIHVKDTLTDGAHPSELILEQLEEHAANLAQGGAALGCEFEVAESGTDYWF